MTYNNFLNISLQYLALLLIRAFPNAGVNKDDVCYILNMTYTINVLIHLHFYVLMLVQRELDDVYILHLLMVLYEIQEIFSATRRDKTFRFNQAAYLSDNLQIGKLIKRYAFILLLYGLLLGGHLLS